MPEMLSSGHVVTDEDVDTARLIIELDRALGRATDPLTQQVADVPAHRVRTVLAEPARTAGVNGHRLPRADALARSVAEEVGSELPATLDPTEQARVVNRIEDVLRRRMGQLAAEADPGR